MKTFTEAFITKNNIKDAAKANAPIKTKNTNIPQIKKDYQDALYDIYGYKMEDFKNIKRGIIKFHFNKRTYVNEFIDDYRQYSSVFKIDEKYPTWLTILVNIMEDIVRDEYGKENVNQEMFEILISMIEWFEFDDKIEWENL